MSKILSRNVSETKKIAANFAKNLKKGDVLCLFGNLGSGKTSFIQGLAIGLEIDKRIISPTFIIVRTYKTKKFNFYHIDLYRTETENDLLTLGLEEIIAEKENIVAIEWAERLSRLLPRTRIDINFKYIDKKTREISITRHV